MLWRGDGREQNLKQERQVAYDLDVSTREPRQQPVGRKPRDTHEEADEGCKRNSDSGDEERIEQSDQKHAAIAVGLIVRNKRLVDAEPGGIDQETKAAADALSAQIGLGVERELIAKVEERREQRELIEQGAKGRIVAQWHRRRRRGTAHVTRYVSVHRTGGAY